MLNPSYADSTIYDLTLNRCINFSKLWGYGKMNIVNLFGLRSSNPKVLYHHDSPIGTENDKYILKAAEESNLVIFAWGEKHCKIKNRNKEVFLLLSNYNPHYIKKTIKGNYPRHPSRLKKDLHPTPF